MWAVVAFLALFVGVGLVVNTENRPYASQRDAYAAGYSTGHTAGESAGYRSGYSAGSPRTAPSAAAPATPDRPADTFTAGTRTVGDGPDEFPAGTYRTAGPAGSGSCYWARLSGTGGTLDDIIANERVTSGASIVTVRSSDEAIQFRGPCTWLRDDE